MHTHLRRSNLLICNIDVSAFAAVMFVVVFIVMVYSVSALNEHCGVCSDLPITDHPQSMREANREDAMMVGVMRDGRVFFRNEAILPAHLSVKIRDRASLHGIEQKVYLKADARAKYGSVKEVVDAIHDAGIEKLCILVEQRKPPSSTP